MKRRAKKQPKGGTRTPTTRPEQSRPACAFVTTSFASLISAVVRRSSSGPTLWVQVTSACGHRYLQLGVRSDLRGNGSTQRRFSKGPQHLCRVRRSAGRRSASRESVDAAAPAPCARATSRAPNLHGDPSIKPAPGCNGLAREGSTQSIRLSSSAHLDI